MFDRVSIPTSDAEPEKPATVIPRMTMTVEEMAVEMSISRATAYKLAREEGFPSFHIGQRLLINRKGLQEWIDNQCRTDPAA